MKTIAWMTLVQTTARMPPRLMYATLMRMKSTMTGAIGHPISTDIARQAAMSRTPEPMSRVTKKNSDAVVWVSRPNLTPRNS
jgi:hypothetical protein